MQLFVEESSIKSGEVRWYMSATIWWTVSAIMLMFVKCWISHTVELQWLNMQISLTVNGFKVSGIVLSIFHWTQNMVPRNETIRKVKLSLPGMCFHKNMFVTEIQKRLGVFFQKMCYNNAKLEYCEMIMYISLTLWTCVLIKY